MTYTIEILETESPEALTAIGDALEAFNTAQAGPSPHQPLSILLKHPETNAILGGLTGSSSHDWLFIKLFFIPESLRGQNLGTRLIAQAEAIARARNLTGIWLDTFEFQARGFYEKQGFTLFATLPDHPKGHNRYFLQKRLA
jgi:GNAT superfamily N-acetyltransferase